MESTINTILSFWPVAAIGVAVAVIWHVIYVVLHRREQNGQAMSQLQVQWMEAAKFSRYLFLALPFALLIIMPLVELVSGVVVVAFIAVMMLIGLLKGKLF